MTCIAFPNQAFLPQSPQQMRRCRLPLDEPPAEASRMAWSPDGTLAVNVGDRTSTHLLRPGPDGQWTVHRLEHPEPVTALAWSPRGALAVGDIEGSGAVYRLAQPPEVLHTLPEHLDFIWTMAWSPQGLLAVGSYGGDVSVHSPGGEGSWSVSFLLGPTRVGWTPPATNPAGADLPALLRDVGRAPAWAGITCLAWHPRRPLLAVGNQDGRVFLVEQTQAGTWRTRRLTDETSDIQALAWGPEDVLVVSGLDDFILLAHPGRSGGWETLRRPVPASTAPVAWGPQKILALPGGVLVDARGREAGRYPCQDEVRFLVWSRSGELVVVTTDEMYVVGRDGGVVHREKMPGEVLHAAAGAHGLAVAAGDEWLVWTP